MKKDLASGPFAEEWKTALEGADIKEEDQVDLGSILSNAALAVKDEKELVSYYGPCWQVSSTDNIISEQSEMRHEHQAH